MHAMMGVDVLRISPQTQHTTHVIKYYADAIDGSCTAIDAQNKINKLITTAACDGYWYCETGFDQVSEAVILSFKPPTTTALSCKISDRSVKE